MREKWINDIKERMDDFTSEVPDNLMDDIQKEMIHRGLQTAPAQKHRRIALWYPAVSAAAALLALYLGWNFGGKDMDERHPMAQQIQEATLVMDSLRNTVQKGITEEPFLAMKRREESDVQPLVNSLLPHPVSSKSGDASEVGEKTPEKALPAGDEETVSTEEISEKNQAENVQKRLEQNTTKEHTRKKNSTFEYTLPRKTRKDGISAGAYYSGVMANHSQSGRGLMLSAANPYGAYRQDLSGERVDGLLNQTEDHEISVHHDQPIKVGISVDIPLNHRWSIQTGVTYSFLSSEISQEQPLYAHVSKQKLHYVGIPVRANYQWWEHKGWKIYSAAGGEVERMVSGKLKNHQKVGDKIKSASSHTLKESKLQFSGNVMTGVEYQWSKKVGIYAEAGASYYFDNGSHIQTIYTEKPFNFSLAVGFRFHTK